MRRENCEKLILDMVNFYSLFEKEFSELMPELINSEITPLLSRMLNEIYIQGKTTSSNLSKVMNLSIPNTSRSVNTLYKLGYISKKQDLDDKRIVYLSLSTRGLELILKNINISQEKFLKRFELLTDEEVLKLINSFSQINNILIKMRELNGIK